MRGGDYRGTRPLGSSTQPARSEGAKGLRAPDRRLVDAAFVSGLVSPSGLLRGGVAEVEAGGTVEGVCGRAGAAPFLSGTASSTASQHRTSRASPITGNWERDVLARRGIGKSARRTSLGISAVCRVSVPRGTLIDDLVFAVTDVRYDEGPPLVLIR